MQDSPRQILVHICCGPCSIYPLKKIFSEGSFKISGFFYNPNIHPLQEFKKRLESVKTLARLMDVDVVCFEDYDPLPYFSVLAGTDKKSIPRDERCESCYGLRLEKTAQFAYLRGYGGFSTSLLYSRYQNHEQIISLGLYMGEKYGVPFYHEDFRTGWKEGITASKEMGLYRQKYCGCVFSKYERADKNRGKILV